MTPDARLLAYSALLCWVMILVSSALRTRGQVGLAFGNRDDLPEPSPVAARADRAAKNMIENLVLFTAFLAAARFGKGDPDRIVLGARIFFWARVAYFPIYLAGIPRIRTVAWAAGVGGMGVVMSSAW